MGLTATGLDGTVKWSRVYPAGAVPPLAGHKSHPYALAAVKVGCACACACACELCLCQCLWAVPVGCTCELCL